MYSRLYNSQIYEQLVKKEQGTFNMAIFTSTKSGRWAVNLIGNCSQHMYFILLITNGFILTLQNN